MFSFNRCTCSSMKRFASRTCLKMPASSHCDDDQEVEMANGLKMSFGWTIHDRILRKRHPIDTKTSDEDNQKKTREEYGQSHCHSSGEGASDAGQRLE